MSALTYSLKLKTVFAFHIFAIYSTPEPISPRQNERDELWDLDSVIIMSCVYIEILLSIP